MGLERADTSGPGVVLERDEDDVDLDEENQDDEDEHDDEGENVEDGEGDFEED